MPNSRTNSARRRSAWLSLAAAGVTAAILVWAVLRNSDHTRWWFVWVLTIGVPPIALSIIAAAQYGRGRSTGAGAAAAAVYWVLLIIYNVRAGQLYLIGGLLQTAAWFLSRPGRNAGTAEEQAAVSKHN